MIRMLLIAAPLILGACVGPAAETAPPAFALGVDLACDAGDLQQCPPGGCGAAAPETMTLHISLLVPERGGAGRFCIATGCEDAQFTPTSSPAPGWAARMHTRERTQYDAHLQIAPDLRTFSLRQADADGVKTWTGICSAAGS